jgi:catechol 2,3-dioxygenase-like lactoylglutathione lyase family enzyme
VTRPASGAGLTLDHVELFVPDRERAAAWYATVLGCGPAAGTEGWAADPSGPLMITPDGGRTKLALFEGEPPGDGRTTGFHRVAFRCAATEWTRFAAGLLEQGIPTRTVDHGAALSVYFRDPDGHHLEVTTYEADEVRRATR